eukprot:CAMPEP_0197286968 /NCGR_PEP_ID=MMETSP0890-20130614/2871_1 /TAXON_ID=44058 ORGANISM="Aureoumbra lagunensis, Strain CCMP1510" /NCGR_SAMPLE_ID=MMETSP0890 /ASSEMBLY_ACC=CAM_ASM_000533 /LENGTH=202 /DNA_ID=CAMNT_0042756039 /DNA_START=349 /DNA_END=958 /DNA_ORIENTATION=-
MYATRGKFDDSCWFCRECFVDCGRQGLYVCAAGSSGFLIGGIILAATSEHVLPGTFFATFFAMKALSYFGEVLPLAYFFYTRREKQRHFWLDGVAGGAYPLGPSFPDPLFLRESRHDGEIQKWPESRQRERAGGHAIHNPILQKDGAVLNGVRPTIDPAQRQADRQLRRERQIEMLRRTREQVRSNEEQRSPDALAHLGSRS